MRRSPCLIPIELEILELRDSYSKNAHDLFQPRIANVLRSLGNLLQEITAVRVINFARRAIGLTHQLWHEVKIPNPSEEVRNISKVFVDIDLFEIRLSEPLGVRTVFSVGPDPK